MKAPKLEPPGELLREEFLKPVGLTVAGLARATGWPGIEGDAVLRPTRRRLIQQTGFATNLPPNTSGMVSAARRKASVSMWV